MIRTGIAGTGHLGQLHLKLLKEIAKKDKDIVISGIFDIDKKTAKEVSDNFEVNLFNSIDELINNSDAVIVVTSTKSHFEIAEKIITAGKNIFIEKPVTETISQAEELLKLKKSAQQKIQVGHIERFNPAILALDKYDVKPLFIESHRMAQFNPRGADVSVIQDLMIHDIDIILKLIDSKIKYINANGVAILTDSIDIANARLTFENGAVANITASRISIDKMRKMRIFQKNAYISINFLSQESVIYHLKNAEDVKSIFSIDLGNNKKVEREKVTIQKINPMKYEQEKFFESIKNNSLEIVTLEEGKTALEVASAIISEVENSIRFIKSRNDI
ncbi:MAG TPA: Gfo/Idh/MocA family oxidoreductase [Ignavibacteria bacterium]|nr:Gfo/Idh/MocA family oxidoreductase [Ignavibacteria bacterium]